MSSSKTTAKPAAASASDDAPTKTSSAATASPAAKTATTATTTTTSTDDASSAQVDVKAVLAENKALKAELEELKAKYAQLGEEVKALFANPGALSTALQGNLGPAVAGGATTKSLDTVAPADAADVLSADSSQGFVPLGGATLDTSTASSAGKFVGVPMDEEGEAPEDVTGDDVVCVEKTTNGKYPELGICGYPKSKGFCLTSLAVEGGSLCSRLERTFTDDHPFRHPFKPGKLPKVSLTLFVGRVLGNRGQQV